MRSRTTSTYRSASDALNRAPARSSSPRRSRCSKDPRTASGSMSRSFAQHFRAAPPLGAVFAEELQHDDALRTGIAVGKLLGFVVHGKVRPFRATAPGWLLPARGPKLRLTRTEDRKPTPGHKKCPNQRLYREGPCVLTLTHKRRGSGHYEYRPEASSIPPPSKRPVSPGGPFHLSGGAVPWIGQ
jgi:hypothetical protein